MQIKLVVVVVVVVGVSRLFRPVASLRFSARDIILPEPPFTKFVLSAFDVSETPFFLWGGAVNPTPKPQPGGSGAVFVWTLTSRPARQG